ncbi:MAG: amidohydrolase family protein [Balneolaceae bacterium]
MRLSGLLSMTLGIFLIPALLPAQEPASVNDWEVEQAHGPTHTLAFEATEGTWMSLDVSPDGQWLLFDLLGHLYEMPIEGGAARPLTTGRSWNLTPRYSPDGSSITFTSDRREAHDVWVMDRDSGELTNLSQNEENPTRPHWMPGGEQILSDGVLYDLDGTATRLPGGRSSLGIPAPDGSGIWFENGGNLYPFVFNPYTPPAAGYSIEFYDLERGELTPRIERSGGAFGPTPSPDGRHLAYLNRNIDQTLLLLHDLETREDRILIREGLDIDRQERGGNGGPWPNLAWHPDGSALYLTMKGKIHRMDIESGQITPIPFRAPVRREMTRRPDIRVDLPGDTGQTRHHRWAFRSGNTLFFETLGDIWTRRADPPTNPAPTQPPASSGESGSTDLQNRTGSDSNEISPVFDETTGTLFVADWNDRELGSIQAIRPDGTRDTLTTVPTQYGSLALSPDGTRLAYMRGTGMLHQGRPLSDEVRLELVVTDLRALPPGADERAGTRSASMADAKPAEGPVEQVVTAVRGPQMMYANIAAKVPPHVRFSPDGRELIYTEFIDDTLAVRAIEPDTGTLDSNASAHPRTLLKLPYATEASVSPGLEWIAFREYNRSWLAPMPERTVADGSESGTHADAPVINAMDSLGTTWRVDTEDGIYHSWPDGDRVLGWTRASGYYEKPVAQILDEGASGSALDAMEQAGADAWNQDRVPGSSATRQDLGVSFPTDRARGVMAFTNARIVTMNEEREVIERGTLLIRDGRIEAIGSNVEIPDEADVRSLDGHTLLPGLVDAHSHPHIEHSSFHIIEQHPPYLRAPLAYGITTLMEVYGNEHRDGWLSDMQRAGKIDSPRIFTTGSALYGRRSSRNRMYRPIESLAGAREQVRWNRDHGAIAVKDYVQVTRMKRHWTMRAAREQGLYVLSESASYPQMNLTQVLDGIAGLEHSMALDTFYSDVVRFWAASGAGITPTLVVLYGAPYAEAWYHQNEKLWEDEKLTQFLPPQHLMRIRRGTRLWREDFRAPEMARAMKTLHDAGVPVQAGGHGQMMGLDLHWEMEMLTMGGFSEMEAMAAATINGAVHHGLDHEIGSIEPGKRADLVVLRANPLEEIRNTRDIRYVMQDGILHDGMDASRIWPDRTDPKPPYYRVP